MSNNADDRLGLVKCRVCNRARLFGISRNTIDEARQYLNGNNFRNISDSERATFKNKFPTLKYMQRRALFNCARCAIDDNSYYEAIRNRTRPSKRSVIAAKIEALSRRYTDFATLNNRLKNRYADVWEDIPDYKRKNILDLARGIRKTKSMMTVLNEVRPRAKSDDLDKIMGEGKIKTHKKKSKYSSKKNKPLSNKEMIKELNMLINIPRSKKSSVDLSGEYFINFDDPDPSIEKKPGSQKAISARVKEKLKQNQDEIKLIYKYKPRIKFKPTDSTIDLYKKKTRKNRKRKRLDSKVYEVPKKYKK